MKLPYEDEDICRIYRNAANKRKQIKILADMNCCSREEIKRVLRRFGERLPEEKAKRERSYRKWTTKEITDAIEMRSRGLSYAEIGNRLGRNAIQVSSKLSQMKLSSERNTDGHAHSITSARSVK